MAGGVGSRFWPMSTPEHPKQFIDVLGCGRTLLQLTVDRFSGLVPMSNFWVVTSARYKSLVAPAATLCQNTKGAANSPGTAAQTQRTARPVGGMMTAVRRSSCSVTYR